MNTVATEIQPEPDGESAPPSPSVRFGPPWIVTAVVGWVLTTLVCLGLVVYALGPMLANNDQRAALADLRGQRDKAVG